MRTRTVRIPEQLYEVAAAKAASDRRSVTQMVTLLLERALGQPELTTDDAWVAIGEPAPAPSVAEKEWATGDPVPPEIAEYVEPPDLEPDDLEPLFEPVTRHDTVVTDFKGKKK